MSGAPLSWSGDAQLVTDLMGSSILRRRTIRHTAVLRRAGHLKSLPGLTGKFTTKQVAEFYKVPEDTIKKVVQRHRAELTKNGMTHTTVSAVRKLQEKSDTSRRDSVSLVTNQDNPAQVRPDNLALNARVLLFSRRAVLNIGQLLTGSEVAEAVRGFLLEVEQGTDREKIDAILNELEAIHRLTTAMLQRGPKFTITTEVMHLPTPGSGKKPKIVTKKETLYANGSKADDND